MSNKVVATKRDERARTGGLAEQQGANENGLVLPDERTLALLAATLSPAEALANPTAAVRSAAVLWASASSMADIYRALSAGGLSQIKSFLLSGCETIADWETFQQSARRYRIGTDGDSPFLEHVNEHLPRKLRFKSVAALMDALGVEEGSTEVDSVTARGFALLRKALETTARNERRHKQKEALRSKRREDSNSKAGQ